MSGDCNFELPGGCANASVFVRLHQCLLLRRRLLDLRRDRRLPPWVLHAVPPKREAIERLRDLDLVRLERFRPPLSEGIVYI